MKKGDLVKMKIKGWRMDPQAPYWSRVGVIIEPADDQYAVYWSDNIKSDHWAEDLVIKTNNKTVNNCKDC